MLTASDIEKVRNGGMSATIVASAVNVAGAYCDSADASNEREIAEEVLATWLKNAALEVREALARQLRSCPFLPRKLALEMAADVETVAVPILRHSPVFTQDDLCEIAQRRHGQTDRRRREERGAARRCRGAGRDAEGESRRNAGEERGRKAFRTPAAPDRR